MTQNGTKCLIHRKVTSISEKVLAVILGTHAERLCQISQKSDFYFGETTMSITNYSELTNEQGRP